MVGAQVPIVYPAPCLFCAEVTLKLLYTVGLNNLARLSQEEKSRVVLVFYPLTMTASLTPIGQMGLSAHSD